MNTIAFVGSDKNAGKTTALNHVYKNLFGQQNTHTPICVTSIGINGEDVDSFTGLDKPTIELKQDSFFVTARQHLAGLTEYVTTLEMFTGSEFSKEYIFGQCQQDLGLVVEGPNSKNEIQLIKQRIEKYLVDGKLLIDGSIDRCFLASPEISDGFYFSLYLSQDKEQLTKARDLLTPLNFPVCDTSVSSLIVNRLDADTRSLYFNESGELLYHGKQIPFMDDDLKKVCAQQNGNVGRLYLNGALSRSLYLFLADFSNLELVLDNFFLYQNVSTGQQVSPRFLPRLSLYHPSNVLGIFIRREKTVNNGMNDLLAGLPMPSQIPVSDLQKELPYEPDSTRS